MVALALTIGILTMTAIIFLAFYLEDEQDRKERLESEQPAEEEAPEAPEVKWRKFRKWLWKHN